MNANNIKFYLTDQGIVMYGGDNPEDKVALKKLQSDYMAQRRALRKFCDEVPVIKKEARNKNGKLYFLLGKDSEGTKWWLRPPQWECDWYWSFGFMEEFKHNKYWTHFDSMFFGKEDMVAAFKVHFCNGVTVTDKELYQLLEAMKSFYTAEQYRQFLYRKGAFITQMPDNVRNTIASDPEKLRLEKKVIPAICKYAQNLLDPMDKKEDK